MSSRVGLTVALGFVIVGCAGAAPTAQTPEAGSANAAAAPKKKGCDAVREAFSIFDDGLTAPPKSEKNEKTDKGEKPSKQENEAPNASAATAMRNLRLIDRKLADLRAGLRAASSDSSLRDPIASADTALASMSEAARAETKALEADAQVMATALGEIEAAQTTLDTICKKPKDVDCAAVETAQRAYVTMSWTDSASIVRVSKTIAGVAFKNPAGAPARDKIATNLLTIAKQSSALDARREELRKKLDASKMVDSLTPIAKACRLDEEGPQHIATPGWVTAPSPDMRKLVVVVHVKADGRLSSRLRDWASQSQGIRRAAFEGASLGAFGSGFFVVPRKGELLVITNRHVVELGSQAEIEMGDGTKSNAEILYTDPEWDLAVLRPEKQLVDAGLAIDPDAAKDHQTVIATGYPGVGGRPSYQTTRGHVSNQKFLSTDGVPYVQHTAPVDPGGSGGPLTTERGTLLGVNTLKIQERENVAMAVPAAAIVQAIKRAESQERDAAELRSSARDTCLEVVSELSSPKPRMPALYHRISNSMVGDTGSDAFNAIALREQGIEPMLLRSPIATLRIAVAANLVTSARMNGLNPFETCSSPEREDWENISSMDRVRFKVRVGSGTRELVLRREHGGWKLVRLALAPPVDPPPFVPVKGDKTKAVAGVKTKEAIPAGATGSKKAKR